MARRKKLYEGKAKILYEGPAPGTLVQHFKDDATAGNGEKKDVIEGKGVLNNRLSEFFMTGLNAIGVPTHFIRRLNMREQLIRQVEMIPLEVIVRNFAAGSMAKRLGLEEGAALPRPIIEFCYKDDKLGDPLVPEEYVIAFGWASQQDLDDIVAMGLTLKAQIVDVSKCEIRLKIIKIDIESISQLKRFIELNVALSDDVINAVPQSLRDGSYGLGATQSETIKRVIIPAALPGIVSSFLLAISRAVGETMIVVMAAGQSANLTANILDAVTTVTVQIVALLTGDTEFDSVKTLSAFALGLVLFLVTLGLNIYALYVVKKYKEQYD